METLILRLQHGSGTREALGIQGGGGDELRRYILQQLKSTGLGDGLTYGCCKGIDGY